jgi:hypothetical protein
LFFLLEVVSVFFGRKLINAFLACFFILISIYLANNFYIMW